MLILTKSDVERIFSMEDAIKTMEEAFAMFAIGGVDVPLRTVIHAKGSSEGDVFFMPGYINGMDIAVKMVSVFPDNVMKGKPTINSAVMLINELTGECLSVMDGTYLTALRTGAASGAATKYLAKKDSKIAAVIGAGVQARTQLWAVCCVRDIKEARIFNRNKERRASFIAEMSKKLPGVKLIGVDSADEAVEGADVVICATTSEKPVFNAKSLKQGVHINGVGSYTPKMQEIPEEALKMADKIVVDSKEAALEEAGDFIIPIKKGLFNEKDFYGELGQVVSHAIRGRENDDEITIFKSVGLAVQDVACASKIYNKALKLNIGLNVDLNE